MKTTPIRLALATALLTAGFMVAPQGMSPARAGVEYPWCAVYSEASVGATNCGFTTWAQCAATISGVGGMCRENPAYVPSAAQPKRQRHRPR